MRDQLLAAVANGYLVFGPEAWVGVRIQAQRARWACYPEQ
jgi:hypothetical protein